MPRNIKATTFESYPVGTPIEIYKSWRPVKGQEFSVIHADTKKVVNKAKVTGIDQLDARWFLIRAVITKVM